MTTTADVRQAFFEFFKKYDHTIVPSSPVVPVEDPSLLFTNAGMNQFKDVFLGSGSRNFVRAADTQKCIRVSGKHNDLEEVGIDEYHHTFFEMLGNWSFGNYYKAEAIKWAWELVTGIWGLPKDKLWATVFTDDDEAEECWKKVTDIGHNRIVRCGAKDNFWEMGETGPCGPCSEIHIDLGESYGTGPDMYVNGPNDRFREIWNLVFIQYNRDESGKLNELPAKHVDTGMGLERITAILNGVNSNYKIDIFTDLFENIAGLSGKDHAKSREYLNAFRVISDHIRALTFAIADGALPSNEGRGYVLRRILRRAARFGRTLNLHEPFMYKLTSSLIKTMGPAFPEIVDRHEFISKVILSEEESFGKTLDRGLEMFEEFAKKGGGKKIAGRDAFKLYDTFGFPIDLTQLLARERNMTVNMENFNLEMEKQKKRSRKSDGQAGCAVLAVDYDFGTGHSRFHYSKESMDTKIIGMIDPKGQPVITAKEGDIVQIVLDKTPFYAQSGGQVGDTGTITKTDESLFAVDNTVKGGEGLVFQKGSVKKGSFSVNDQVSAIIDSARRMDIKRNHTATHLLHKALQTVLGDHVRQAGSLVAPDHLRFDFNHFGKMTHEEIRTVERMINTEVLADHPVEVFEDLPFLEARERGAMAIFGEKYGDRVRMIQIGNDYSRELCGGTHLSATGKIGLFRIASEGSVAAGIRRIVATTGTYSLEAAYREKDALHSIRSLLSIKEGDEAAEVDRLIEKTKSIETELAKLQKESSLSGMDDLLKKPADVKGIPVVAALVEAESIDNMKEMGDKVREALRGGVSVLAAEIGGKAALVCMVGDDAVKTGLNAGNIIKDIAKIVQGGGGGKPHMATAGGKNPAKLQEAVDKTPDIIGTFVK